MSIRHVLAVYYQDLICYTYVLATYYLYTIYMLATCDTLPSPHPPQRGTGVKVDNTSVGIEASDAWKAEAAWREDGSWQKGFKTSWVLFQLKDNRIWYDVLLMYWGNCIDWLANVRGSIAWQNTHQVAVVFFFLG